MAWLLSSIESGKKLHAATQGRGKNFLCCRRGIQCPVRLRPPCAARWPLTSRTWGHTGMPSASNLEPLVSARILAAQRQKLIFLACIGQREHQCSAMLVNTYHSQHICWYTVKLASVCCQISHVTHGCGGRRVTCYPVP